MKEKIYINPYFTKAEAAAAYQERIQRRLAQQRGKEESASVAEAGKGQRLNQLADSFIQPMSSVAASAAVTED